MNNQEKLEANLKKTLMTVEDRRVELITDALVHFLQSSGVVLVERTRAQETLYSWVGANTK